MRVFTFGVIKKGWVFQVSGLRVDDWKIKGYSYFFNIGCCFIINLVTQIIHV
jgi:hypothetical protein